MEAVEVEVGVEDGVRMRPGKTRPERSTFIGLSGMFWKSSST